MLWAILHNDEKQEKQNSDSEGHKFKFRRAYQLRTYEGNAHEYSNFLYIYILV